MKSAFLTLLCLASCLAPFAQPGSLDSSFRKNGLSVTDFGNDETIRASAVQPDGKIILVGNDVLSGRGSSRPPNTCAIARYLPNGFPDSSFGKNGLVHIRVDSSTNEANFVSVALQKDGKIVVTGNLFPKGSYPPWYFVLFRCLKNGKIDSSFGTNGFVTPSAGEVTTNTLMRTMTIQPDGNILAAGFIAQTASGGAGQSILVVRLTPKGKKDLSFGNKGSRIITLAGNDAKADAIQVLPDGKILLGGLSDVNYASQITAVRLTPSGSTDLSFGKGGSVSTVVSPNGYSYGLSMVLTQNGRFVIGGQAGGGEYVDFALVGYKANGSVDSSFGTNGITITDFGMYDDITSLALQADGKIVAFGITETYYSPGNTYRAKFAVARYAKNGIADAGFGSKGKVITDFGNPVSQAWAGFIQADGRIVAAGVTEAADYNLNFALAGYKPDGTLQLPVYPIAKVMGQKQ